MKISIVVISAVIAVSLTGCSSASSSPSSNDTFIAKPLPAASTTQPLPADTTQPEPNVTPKSTIPSPNAAQKESLLAELTKISPDIITAKTINNARNQCSSLYPTVVPSAINNAQIRFSVFRGHQVTLDEAEAINNIILSNGFCQNT